MGSLKKHIEEFEKNFDNSLDVGHQDNVDTFNSDGAFGLKDITEQHHDELADKDRIIENLKQKLESNWMENKLALNTKKMYEDKIKKMDIVDSTKLIPTLIEVSKQKQGDQILDWTNWLKISENSITFRN